MWEKPRMDGKRKLKYNAVPTIFNNIPACNVDTHVANARASSKIDNECDYFNNIELNVLYNVAGYIVHSIAKGKSAICTTCLNSAGSTKYNANVKYANFVHLKCYRNNTLFFVTQDVFEYFMDMEFIIRQYLSHVSNSKCNLIIFFMEKMKHISCVSLKNCHKLNVKIMKRFIAFRMKIACLKGRLVKPTYNSKTMVMHSVVT
ncbi:uncharacterized protein LOC112590405 [Harpegnathos saltator]|uniref:uncharacterized protein LOC112590405 n=1 Tax=Harpegnathos saltator TaxID=610380 RepID=UPI000DBEF169|nr:uncharacterized protein LOC112590405 [Harpegnathos saltator]